jgi:sugar/nucleoside kinase (ribokinase family)
MVVIARGPGGAWATLGSESDRLVVDQMNVKAADTVGTGDSFMAR